jgi:hypothetical protein
MSTAVTTAELADEARRLATAADVLRDRVTAHVDRIAAGWASRAAGELRDLADILVDLDA